MALCAQSEELNLEVVRKYDKEDWVYKVKIYQKNNLNGYGDLGFVRIMSGVSYSMDRDDRNILDAIRVFADSNLDFWKYYTYDIMITGDDPLVDKSILETFCSSGLFSRYVRDEENPDLIVCLAKSSDESISTTYVPPTTQVVNEGATVRPVYNYLTRTVSYDVKQKNRVEHTEGYTQTTSATDINLEIVVLDAKKMNDPNQKVAPILWQMNYSSHVANRDFKVVDLYMRLASNHCFPFTQPESVKKYSFAMIGAVVMPYEEGTAIVASDVVPGTNAHRLGLQKGDIITKVNGKKDFKISLDVGSLEFRPKFKCAEIFNILTYYQTKDQQNVNVWTLECQMLRSEKNGLVVTKYDSPLHKPKTKYTVKRGDKTIVLQGQLGFDPFTLGTFDAIRVNPNCFDTKNGISNVIL